ncbi:MAG TPA: glycosyltransferase family 2 protein [Acidimicrobiales bacterium]|nr:glycosyltransferase family 2 protein [Acidimicrobiales bacterium]
MRTRTLPKLEYSTLTVLMPVFNEQSTVKEIISRCLLADVPLRVDLIIVDDGSSDDTAKVLAGIDDPRVTVLSHPENQGKGAALRTGLAAARGDLVIVQDADLEYDPSDWRHLVAPVLDGSALVVYGNRFAGKGQNMSGLHWLGNRFLSLVTSLLYAKRLGDMETCYKLFDRRVIEPVHVVSERFDFEPEITAKVLRQGYDIVEVPISYAGREFHEGKKITWRDGFGALRALVRFRFSRSL